MSIEPVIIGDCQLYLGDCLEIIPTLGKVDAVVTDPPYGINAARTRNSQKDGWVDYGCDGWDKERPKKEIFDLILSAGKHHIIWGGNYFTDYLPPSMQWLGWDKGQRDFSLADFELAWSSQKRACRMFDYSRSKALQDGKVHPTQKPIELMKWCIEQLPDDCDSILDPFMGSGTTGVACAKMGRKFIGIEIEPKHFHSACKRIEEAYKQPDMFVEPVKKPTQEAMQLV